MSREKRSAEQHVQHLSGRIASPVDNHPVVASAVQWLLLLNMLSTVLSIRSTDDRAWLDVVVFAACVASAVQIWIFQRHARPQARLADGSLRLFFVFAAASGPFIIMLPLVLEGASPWTLWLALTWNVALVSWWLAHHRRKRPASANAPAPPAP